MTFSGKRGYSIGWVNFSEFEIIQVNLYCATEVHTILSYAHIFEICVTALKEPPMYFVFKGMCHETFNPPFFINQPQEENTFSNSPRYSISMFENFDSAWI